MATKDVTDTMVCLAYKVYNDKRTKRSLGEASQHILDVLNGLKAPDPEPDWPYTILMKMTGQPFKVCWRAMERADKRGYIEYGVSLRTGWLTEKGKQLLTLPNN